MEQFILAFFNGISTRFFINQTLTIIVLAVYGVVFMLMLRGDKATVYDYLLSFPVALGTYSLAGYFMLGAGIKFCKISVIGVMAILLVIVALAYRGSIHKIRVNKTLIFFCLAVIVTAIISTSGLIPVSVTNDSMYYFSEYPRALVRGGFLDSPLDRFLTDASQGIAIIGTLPFLFGYDEIFGILTFLNINFLAIYGITVYEFAKDKLDRKGSIIAGVLSVLMLLSSMPFLIMSKWAMANLFYMEYMAIIAFVAYRFSKDAKKSDLIILSILITAISIMRMEGALNAGVLVLCIMMLSYRSIDITCFMVLPMTILQSLYLFRIFILITLHTKVQFMTRGKAMVLILFLIAIMLYAMLIRGRLFRSLEKFYPYILVVGLFAANIMVLLYDRGDYISNLYIFTQNILRHGGWGVFASFVVGVMLLVPVKSVKINFFDIVTICFILLTIVLGWARGDVLIQGFGDSGNRMLIQAVPILVFCLSLKVIEGLNYYKNLEE